MPYIPALDGIRAFAVLLVFAFHARVPGFNTGYVGVDIFFVLSGFLITSILLKEYDSTCTLRIGRFYLRRFARLMPALLGMLALYVALAPSLWPTYIWHQRDALIALTYFGDSIPAFWHSASPIRHTWSLAVEEHYYLLWPVIILILMRKFPAKLPQILFATFLAATAWRIYCVTSGQSWHMVYFRFDMRLSGLIFGAWLGACVHRNPQMTAPSIKWTAPATLLGSLLILGTAWEDPLGLTLSVPAAEILTVLMILVLLKAGTSTLHRLMNAPSMVYLGKISYGLYLYHFPVIVYLRLHFDWPMVLAIGLPVSIAIAAISYHTIENIGRTLLRRPPATPRPYESVS